MKQYENYDPEVDTEHKELWGDALPGTREELIRWACELANLTGKRVCINAMSIVPDDPEPTDWFAVVGWTIGGAFLLILALGLLVSLFAVLTGNVVY